MFYLKAEIDGKIRNVEIYDDEIHTICFICGKEFQVDTGLIKFIFEDDNDFSSTRLSCGCGDKVPKNQPKLIRIK